MDVTLQVEQPFGNQEVTMTIEVTREEDCSCTIQEACFPDGLMELLHQPAQPTSVHTLIFVCF